MSNVSLPELWEPVGTKVTRDLPDAALKELASRHLRVQTCWLTLYERRINGDLQSCWISVRGHHAEHGLSGTGTTPEEARAAFVQKLVDTLRTEFRKLLELAGPRAL